MTRKIALVAGLIVIVMLVAWYEGMLRPENSHIQSLRAKQQVAATSLASLEDRYVGLINAKRKLPAERVALARLEQLVPDGPDLDTLEKVLFNLAATAGVQLSSIASPAPSGYGTGIASGSSASSSSPGPNQLQLTLGVSGSASQIEDLYRLLDSNPRLFVIDNCSLSLAKAPASGNGLGNQTELEIRAFFVSASPDSAVS